MIENSGLDAESVIAGIVFSLLFFVLGLVFKVVSDYRSDSKDRLKRLNDLLFTHSHNEDGTPFIPRK